MNLADVAPQPAFLLSTAGCIALSCLFLTSAAVLVVVLVRRGRKQKAGGPDGVA